MALSQNRMRSQFLAGFKPQAIRSLVNAIVKSYLAAQEVTIEAAERWRNTVKLLDEEPLEALFPEYPVVS